MVIICDDTFNQKHELSEKMFSFIAPSFELSDFQKWAIYHTIIGNHVLITAHTGSGKTLPAEFMIQWFVNQCGNDTHQPKKKVIYASPIKALSNQKLHDMRAKYPHISFGLITGDVKDNPDADVLIMTTEILRNTLFNMQVSKKTNTDMPLSFNINIETELGGVVFDEVHYINDPDRGAVWEQSILLLPPHIQLLMLSATINKPEGFAKWIEDQKTLQANQAGIDPKKVILAPTYERVVPLNHYVWLTSNKHASKKAKRSDIEPLLNSHCNKLVTIKTSKGQFVTNNYNAVAKIKGWMYDNRIWIKRPHVLNDIVRYLKTNNMIPAITFVFSRKHVELAAAEIEVSLYEEGDIAPSIVEKECRKIIASKLPNYQEYLELEEYKNLIKLLQKGIAIHHGGIMPVLREMVEMLFDKGFIKLLFATETFAVGINMPTKTVIFTSLEKWETGGKHLLYPHQYTQMAGRAGRRGLDTVGHVIHCNNLFNMPTSGEYKNMLCGPPQKLTSKFKVSYGLVLNVINSGAQNLDMIYNFVSQSLISKDIDNEVKHYDLTLKELEQKHASLKDSTKYLETPKDDLDRYLTLSKTINTLSQKQRKKAQREMTNIQQSCKTFDRDLQLLEKITDIENEINNNTSYRDNASSYLKSEADTVCNILANEGYITISNTNGENVYSITDLGIAASQLQEVHSTAFAAVVIETNYFESFAAEDIAAVLSCFTNIRVPEETTALTPQTGIQHIDHALVQIQKGIQLFQQKEADVRICTGENTDIHFNLANSIIEWSHCSTESECRNILSQICNDSSQIFLGDFIKAILKINNIAAELEKVAEIKGEIKLLEKLNNIPTMTLKYVASNQSLYI